jgi:PAS domain S-box-containing protein
MLVQVGAACLLVVLLVTATVYVLIYRTAESRLRHDRDRSVSEWAAREEAPPGLAEEDIREFATQAATQALYAGLGALVVALALIASILRRLVRRPLDALLVATNDLSSGASGGVATLAEDRELVTRPDELGRLAAAFVEMARRIEQRDQTIQVEKSGLEEALARLHRSQEEIRRLNADIERRIAERAAELSASEARFRLLGESAPEAIYVLDVERYRFIYANENAARLIGRSVDELLGLSPDDVAPATQPDGRPTPEYAAERIREMLERGEVVFEWTAKNLRTGELIPCEVRAVQLPDASGRTLVRGSVTDIRDRKRAERELLRALGREKELGELKSSFVSMVSHEFRTPLGIIHSSAEILDRYFDRLPPERRQEQLRQITQAAHGLATLIDEVLVLSRAEAGKMQFVPGALDLDALVRRIADEVLSASGRRCPIDVQTEDLDGLALGDEGLLRHILTNLLSNAVKYSEPGGPILLRARRAGTDAVFTVRDEGIGIDPEDQRRLFSAFQRGRNVGDRPGSGLGLVIVRRCVQLHGGSIALRSAPGEGTVVTVRVPMFQVESARRLVGA